MKIAIFGDSYSSTYAYNHAKLYEGWAELLAREFDVENFSENGSCLAYMKKKFDSNYDRFDKIVFCVTAPGRLEFKVQNLENNKKYVPWYRHIPTIRSIEARLKIPDLTLEDKRRYTALYDYLLYVQDEEHEKYIHNIILKDIIHTRPDTILIPCFPHSLFDKQTSLEDITIFEDKILNLNTGFYHDQRKCHMSVENNQLVYKKILHAILKDQLVIDLDPSEFVVPSKDLKKFIITP